MFAGGSKNKIWDILGHFGHNWALKKGREKQVYCHIWGLVDHCGTARSLKKFDNLIILKITKKHKVIPEGISYAILIAEQEEQEENTKM